MRIGKGNSHALQHIREVCNIEYKSEFLFTKQDFIMLKKLGIIPKGSRYSNYWYSNRLICNTKNNIVLEIYND